MQGQACPSADNQGQALLDAGHSLAADAASAVVAGRMGGEVPTGIAWLSSRSEHWPPSNGQEAVVGVAYLQFEIGTNDAGWLARLARSSWFAGLEPQADDLAVFGGLPCGTWVMPDGWAAAESARVAAETEAFFASEPLPSAWLAAVAVPHGAGVAGQAAALGLVGALRARRDPGGRALSVVVTVEAAPSLATDTFVRMLLDWGAFVVRPDAGPATVAAGDHLHHLPLRTLTNPRGGRLIGVDFEDTMHIWRPGRVADLHVLPFAGGDAGVVLSGLPSSAGEGVCALSLGLPPRTRRYRSGLGGGGPLRVPVSRGAAGA